MESLFDEGKGFSEIVCREATGSLKWDKYASQVDREGRPVLPLWVADLDFLSAPEILQALHERTHHGVFGYTVPDFAAHQAVLGYLERTHGYRGHPDELFWMHGCVPGLNVFCRAFGEPGDAVMTCTPVYPPFLSAPVWQGKQLITSPLIRVGRRWTFDFDDLEARVTPRTRSFILCNPHNPVGTVYTRAELLRLADFCLRHRLILCSDEIHCDLLFRGNQHIMTATLSDEIARNTVTLHAPSKTYNLPGLAAAFAVIPDSGLRQAFRQAARGFVTEVNCMGYAGCKAAYNHGESWRRSLMGYLEQNRALLYETVAESLSPWMRLEHDMEATYLAWINVEAMLEHGIARPQAWLIENAGVALSPGADFHDARFLRLNFGCPRETLEIALSRIREAFARLA